MVSLSEKLPPNAIESEQLVLGCMMANPDTVLPAVSTLKPQDFYNPAHKRIFSSMVTLHEEGDPIDVVTVCTQLVNDGTLKSSGGRKYINDLALQIITTANVEYHIKKVHQKSVLRNMIIVGNQIINRAYSDDQFSTVLDEVETIASSIGDNRIVDNVIHAKDVVYKNLNDIVERYESDNDIAGLSTGFRDIDSITAGLHPSDLIILAGRPSQGKMQRNSEPVLTDNGWKPIGSLKVNDKVYGSDGNLCNVTGIFPHKNKEVYRVYFDDDSYTDCGLEHLWLTQTSKQRRGKVKDTEPKVKTTKEILETLKEGNRNNHSIEYVKPISFPKKDLPVDPWLMGIYLGDGCYCHGCVKISNTETDIIERISSILPDDCEIKPESSINPNGKDWRISKYYSGHEKTSLAESIINLGLNGKRSYEKFIPDIYLHSDIEDRTKLLHGLVDSDGYIDKNSIEISTTSKRMAHGIVYLVRSLGGRATFKIKQGAYRKNGIKTETRAYYRITFSFATGFIPAGSKKHLAKYTGNKQYHKRFITNIEYIDNDNCTCITVDSQDHQYITRSFILTHNTALSLNIAGHATLSCKVPTAFFSLEMSKEQLIQRLMCSEGRIDSNAVRIGKGLTAEDFERLGEVTKRISKAPLFIDDTPRATVLDIRAKARKIKRDNPDLGLVIIDYLQLMEGNERDRVQEISKISRGLKQLARELNVPVVALSQLSRAVEQRQNKRPILSDLRDSGSIEQDADIVMFVYRDEYYYPENIENRGDAEIIIGKQRNGAVGTVKLLYHNHLTRFENTYGG